MADEFDIQQSLQDQSDEFLMQNRQFAWIAECQIRLPYLYILTTHFIFLKVFFNI